MDTKLQKLEEITGYIVNEMFASASTKSYINPKTLKGGCQDVPIKVYERIDACPELDTNKIRVLSVLLVKTPNSPARTHILIDYEGYTLDPTHSQYNPNTSKFVWAPDDPYPLKVKKVRDITNILIHNIYKYW